MSEPLNDSPALTRRFPLVAAIVVSCVVVACAIYANLSWAVTNPVHYRYFPPFQPHQNANVNQHLGAEYFNIARSMVAGEGFANPFGQSTGPTAWMPPILPALLAGILWASDGDRDAVIAMVVFLQTLVLIGTGLLVLALARKTTSRLGTGVAAGVFLLGLLWHFRLCFQFTHDSWLILLAVDLLIAGLCWFQPLRNWKSAAGWGLLGGTCALINPVVGFVWGVFSLLIGYQRRSWPPLAVALLAAVLTLTPWTVRNYLVFGRLIPVKSNLAYELYQSQCLQPDGLIQRDTFRAHPYAAAGRERQEYTDLGEIAFLEQKRQRFWQSVGADPADFLERVASRFLGAVVWYEPFNPASEARRPWGLWLSRLTYPLPFLALLVIAVTAVRQRVHWAQWVIIGVYLFYLLPYIGVSYYERYAMPLLGVKVLLVVWGADRLLAFWPRRQPASELGPAETVVAAPCGERHANPESLVQVPSPGL